MVPRVCGTVGFQNCGHDTLQNWQLEIHLPNELSLRRVKS